MTTTPPKRLPSPWKLSADEKNGFNPDEKAEKIAKKTAQKKAEFEKNLAKFLGKDPEMNILIDSITDIERIIKEIQNDKDLGRDAKGKLIEKRKEKLNQLVQDKKIKQLSPEQKEQIKNYMQKKVGQIDEMLTVNMPVYSINAELATKSIEQYEKEIKDIEEKIAQEDEGDIKEPYVETLAKKQKALEHARGLQEGGEKLKTGTIHGISKKNLEKTRSDLKREMRKHGRDRYTVEGGKFVDTKNNNKKIVNLQEFDTKFQNHDNYTITFSNENIALVTLNQDNEYSYVMDLHTMKYVGRHDNIKTTIGSKQLYKVYGEGRYFLLDITTGEKFPDILQECDDGFTVKQFDTVRVVLGFKKDSYNKNNYLYLMLYDYTTLEKIGENTYPPYGNLIKISDLQDKNARGRREYILTSADKNSGEIGVNELAGYTLIEGLRGSYVNGPKEIVFGLVKDEDFAHPVYFFQGSMGNGKTIFRSESGDALVLGSNHRNSACGVFNITKSKWEITQKDAYINTLGTAFKVINDNFTSIVIDDTNSLILHKNGKVEKINGRIIECVSVFDKQQRYSLLITKDAVWKITDKVVGETIDANKPNEPMVKKLEYTLGKKSVEIRDISWQNDYYKKLNSRIVSCVVIPARCDNRDGYILIDKNTGELLYKTLFDSFEEKITGKFTFIEKGLFGSTKTVQ